MINTDDPTVIIHLRVEPVMVKTSGGNLKAFRLAQGMTQAEYVDGNVFVISNPLEQWMADVRGFSGTQTTNTTPQIFFVFDAPGNVGNPGLDDNERSINDIQTEL